MRLNCFRVGSNGLHHDLNELTINDKPRPASAKRTSTDRAAKTKSRILRRHGSADSRASTVSSTLSNPSISLLPPCRKPSDVERTQLESLMMPLPGGERPSRCLRLSHPKIYGDIVESMKQSKGCRDWRNFAVFYEDEVDQRRSAVEEAEKRARDYARRWKQFESFDSETVPSRKTSEEVDMIG